MSRLAMPSGLKRKHPESSQPLLGSLTEQEQALFKAIRSRTDMGIWTRDLKIETKLPDNMVNKSLKTLQAKKLIKEVITIQNKGRKHYMAAEFEPSKEITGGAWYVDGALDTEFLNLLKEQCAKLIYKQRVATSEGIFKVEFSAQKIEEIVRALLLDDAIVELKSNGMGEFDSIPVGKVCYKCTSKRGEPRTGAMASVPCGVCPMISKCTPHGIISPNTCKYYSEWLHF